MRRFPQGPTAAVWLILVACSPAFAQGTASDEERPLTNGLEIAFRSGHADRGFLLSDRPVIQPVAWVSRHGAEFSVWSSFTLGETTDGARPRIVELELTREYKAKRLSIAPALRSFFYHDPLSPYRTQSLEGWLYLSFDVGPFRLFTNHSFDVLTYQGSYFGEAGIKSDGDIGGSLSIGWASARFNNEYAGVPASALNHINAKGWLTAHLTRRLYLGPTLEYNSTVSRRVRAEQLRPTYFLFGLTVGGEF